MATLGPASVLALSDPLLAPAVSPPPPADPFSSGIPAVAAAGASPASTNAKRPLDHDKPAPEPVVDREQILKDVIKEKDKLLNENRLLGDHLMRVAERTSSQLEDESQSGNTEDDSEDIPEYGSRSSLTKSSFVGGGDDTHDVSSMARESLFTTEPIDEDYELGDILLPKLNAEEKNDIASKENAGLHEEMDKCRRENERMLDELRAAYDESDLRIGEVRRDRADFQRDVMADAQNKGFKRANAHKVLKYVSKSIIES